MDTHSAYNQGAVNHVPLPFSASFRSSSLYNSTEGSPSSGTGLFMTMIMPAWYHDGLDVLQWPISGHLVLQPPKLFNHFLSFFHLLLEGLVGYGSRHGRVRIRGE